MNFFQKNIFLFTKMRSVYFFCKSLLIFFFAQNMEVFAREKNSEPSKTALNLSSTALQKAINDLEKISYKGKLSVKNDLQLFPIRLDAEWNEETDKSKTGANRKKGDFRVFSSFLSDPVLDYRFSEDGVTFSAIRSEAITESSEEKMFQRLSVEKPHLPIIPLSHFSYWVFGAPSPNLGIESVEYESFGGIKSIDQATPNNDRWHLEFTYPQDQGTAYPLPQKIHLTHVNSNMNFDLSVTSFDVDTKFFENFSAIYDLKHNL